MSSPRRFCLARSPLEGQPELLPSDRQHALRVLRIQTGERILGLDGQGREWELEVGHVDKRQLELLTLGPAREEAPPGSPGAPLPWIEVWCPLPKAGRAEDMLERLTQLGLARLVPLVSQRCEPQARKTSTGRQERLERAAREAIKQCGRLWMPEIAPPEEFASVLQKGATRLILEPSSHASLAQLLSEGPPAGGWTRAEALVLIAGPEGGFSAVELEALLASGARAAHLGPHVLRIETAVEAALAVAATLLRAPR